MATRVTKVPTRWWGDYARRVDLTVSEVGDLVRSASRTRERFPHVRFRVTAVGPEAYVVGTGLAIWEVAWLARTYGDAETVAEQIFADPTLVAEGLRYAAEHPAQVDAEIRQHTEVTVEELKALLPGIQIIEDDEGGDDDARRSE